jgi:VWFA-related protein
VLRRQVRALGLSGARLLRRAAPAGGALLAAAAAIVTGGTEDPVRVRFLEPAAPALILGETRVTVEATTTADSRIERVEIYLDGRLLSILERPPYTLTFDAGTRFGVKRLRAVAHDAAGRSGAAEIVARPLHVGQYEEVRLVTVVAAVRDRRGRPVLDLRRADFTVLEDGVPQTITHFTPARQPLAVALLIDASNSMNLGGRIEFARRGAEAFAETVDPADRLLVLHFNDGLHGGSQPLPDHRAARDAIAAVHAGGGTALYDALFRTAGRLGAMEGRRVIVLLSDGRDQALADNEPGSLHLFEEALREAHRHDVAIYAIGLGSHLENEMDLSGARSLQEILDTLARETGGRSYYPTRPAQLAGMYRQIAADLKHPYTLGYAPSNRARDGAWRSIAVRVAPAELTVEARRGYYAPAAP